MFYVIGRSTAVMYGPFATRRQARTFRTAKPVGLGSSKRYYRIVELDPDALRPKAAVSPASFMPAGHPAQCGEGMCLCS